LARALLGGLGNMAEPAATADSGAAAPQPDAAKEALQKAIAEFVVDPEKRYSGKVSYYSKLRGYGFIEVEAGLVPENKLFVHWRGIESQDRFPFLVKDLDVEFSIAKWNDRGGMSLRAVRISKPGGESISLQESIDAEKKEFIGGQNIRYTGTMKFFDAKYGYGYITLDAGYAEDVPKELKVERTEINAGGQQPQWMSNLAVEFGIWKTSRGAARAYNVTLPGGIPLTQEALENRQKVGGQAFTGEVKLWNWRQGYGFIKADASVPLPPNVTAKLAEQNAAAAQKATAKGKTPTADEELLYFRKADVNQGTEIDEAKKVKFELYIDDKGAGACNVSLAEP